MSVRSAAKTIVVNNDCVLLNKCSDKNNGEYYSLPGGGQDTLEGLDETAKRECLEETGYEIEVGRFAGVFEEICTDEEIVKSYPEYIHKQYHYFICTLKSDERQKPTEIDEAQEGIEWISIERLKAKEVRLLPDFLIDNIVGMIEEDCSKYYGCERLAHHHG